MLARQVRAVAVDTRGARGRLFACDAQTWRTVYVVRSQHRWVRPQYVLMCYQDKAKQAGTPARDHQKKKIPTDSRCANVYAWSRVNMS